jgi:hypothetical protein
MNNLAEYRAGTDPTDPASRIAIVSLRPDAGQVVVDWLSVPGKSYRVMVSSNLVDEAWTPFAEGIEAAETNSSASLGPAVTNQFIRIELDE